MEKDKRRQTIILKKIVANKTLNLRKPTMQTKARYEKTRRVTRQCKAK